MRSLIPIIVLSICLTASGEVIPIPAPEGWQAEVVPGFDPSIESVIVDSRYGSSTHGAFREQMQKWGPEAVPAIARIYENPKWSHLKNVMIQMLAQSSSEEAKSYLLNRFEALLISEPSEADSSELQAICVNLVKDGSKEFRERLVKAAREGNTAHAVPIAAGLSEIGDDSALGAMVALRERLGRTWAAPDFVDYCISQLRGRMRGLQPIASTPTLDEGPVHRKNPALRRKLLDTAQPPSCEYDAAQLVSQLVEAEGEEAIVFLSKLTTNSKLSSDVRRQAVAGLGLIGSRKAVSAYVKLREDAFKKDWAPKPKSQYTHADKIAEAASMTVNVIPDERPADGRTDLADPKLKYAWVSEDYAKGSILWFGYSIEARRFGNEWIVVSAQRIPIP